MIPEAAADELTRLSVNLNQETALAIKQIARRSGLSVTEVIRRAISISAYLDEESRNGRKVHTMDYGGSNARELVFK